MSKPLSGRTALVTGASRGIGFATALALANAGAHVVALARTVGGLEELDDEIKKAGSTATLVPLDLKDLDGIARLGAALNERFGKLDVMVANAGLLGPLSPLSHVEPKVWTELIAVNVTANWQLIRCMEPLLQKSDAGRAVLVTSGASSKGEAYWGPYATSKAALDAMARSWAAENATTEFEDQSVQPGCGPHPHARDRVSGRRPRHAHGTGSGGSKDCRAVFAGRDRERRALFIPRRQVSEVQQAVVTLCLSHFRTANRFPLRLEMLRITSSSCPRTDCPSPAASA